MGFKCGIVGLPNVGKSTLFNALTNSSKAQAENFPFCTIDPNIGIVPVPDERIDRLSEISGSKKKIYTTISFVDIAGLVKGASKGEGLGNKFLSHIREVDAIVHMIRCFDSEDIQNVNTSVDPIRDLEIIETEMMLADIESLQKRLDKKNKKNLDEKLLEILENAFEALNNGKDLSIFANKYDDKIINQTGLLTIKPKIYVCNVDEESIKNGNNYTNNFIKKFGSQNTIIISADIENQINQFEKEEKKNFMNMIDINDTGLNKLISKGYNILKLETFFTSGPEETRAWTDFIENNGWSNSRSNGKMRLEGKDYIVKDGDVLNFRFNTWPNFFHAKIN